MNLRLTDYTPAQGRTLTALLRVVLEDVGLEIRDIGLHQAGEKRWIVMPRRKIIEKGDYRFFSFILFQEKEDFQIFSKMVLELVSARQHEGQQNDAVNG